MCATDVFFKNKKKCKSTLVLNCKSNRVRIPAVVSPRRQGGGRGHDLPPQGGAGGRGLATPRRHRGREAVRCGWRREEVAARRRRSAAVVVGARRRSS